MDTQFLYNAIFGVVSFLGGWIFKMIWSRMTDLDDDLEKLEKHHEDDLKEMRKEMSELALSLPEKYVSKQDLDKLIDFINERFNKLENKIDQLKLS
jgi:hypothetical protein|tara:strand:- start:5494 stop:5781 length:288 start_codon:yes stop_codon:yes gene_type:complete